LYLVVGLGGIGRGLDFARRADYLSALTRHPMPRFAPGFVVPWGAVAKDKHVQLKFQNE
jgi:hypothetical protein